MKVISGKGGGIVFRTDMSNGKYYKFQVDQDGAYSLTVSTNLIGPDVLLLTDHFWAIKTGLNQTNTIAVIANGSVLFFYVNMQFMRSVNDTTLDAGNVGLLARSSSSQFGEAAYSNLQIWRL